jgi:hypothetical protein
MPVGNASSRSSGHRPETEQAVERWAVPLGRLGPTRLSLSYAVFFSAAIVAAIILAVWVRPNNGDLPRAALVGVAFWIGGWMIQLVTHLLTAWLLGLRTSRLNIGLIGLEAAPRPWPAAKTMVVSLCTIVSLLLMGILFRLIEGDFRMPVLSRVPRELWRAPSIGFTPHDLMWRSGAWLCWIQCLFQMYPLPRTMGRQTLAALTGICGRGLDLAIQSLILRRCLRAVALLTVFVAVVLIADETETLVLRWPLLMMLGILLWLSAQTGDVASILAGFRSQPHDLDSPTDFGGGRHRYRRSGAFSSIARAVRSRHDRRRLKLALEKERSEAVDATRLDEILHRVHNDGIDSLSREERTILQRVSRNLRNQRQTDAE